MSDEACIECGHTQAQHLDPSGDNDDCEGCYVEGRAVLCDKWRDEPRGAGMEDGECFRGGEAADFQRDQMAAWQRLK
jgi:hypothetical protein